MNRYYEYPHASPGRQRQCIGIARLLASRPRFIIFDEPTSAFDVSVQAPVLELMPSLHAESNLAYLLINHNLAVVRERAGRVGILRHGVLIEEAVEEIFENPTHAHKKLPISAVPDVDEALVWRRFN